jgi:hypothetical protein
MSRAAFIGSSGNTPDRSTSRGEWLASQVRRLLEWGPAVPCVIKTETFVCDDIECCVRSLRTLTEAVYARRNEQQGTLSQRGS